jgi:hypothetical protein
VSIRALEEWKEKEVLMNYISYNLANMCYFGKKMIGFIGDWAATVVAESNGVATTLEK